MGPSLERNGLKTVIASVVAGIGLYTIFIGASSGYGSLEHLGELGLQVWLAVLALSLVNYGLRFLRWHGYLHRLAQPVPLRPDLTVYLAGFAFTATPGKAGEALRSMYLAPWGVGTSASLAAFFTERLMDLLVMVALGALVVVYQPGYVGLVAGLAVMVLAALWLLQRPMLARVLRPAVGAPSGRIRQLRRHGADLLAASAGLLRSRVLYTGFGIGLLAWGAEGVGLYLILQDLGIPVGALAAIGIYAISVLVGALSFLPGGLGSTEAAMAGLLMVAGAPAGEAITATLVCRVATLWFAVALGALALARLEVGRWRTRAGTAG